ncbi:MAG: molybdopterin-guanine dinucleotide biosynthesis protein B [Gammaproteobacteria bacterium]|jgi:molybdopterin-guanine dinucleotide biosynthesis adapter protein|nr:molybdopterin-guanine dinucleotide biosynthesis protein B [Gammaproteobacteria bacterium]
MNLPDIPLVGVAAYSGTGKTTLLIKLLSIFNERGLRVGVVKHAHHTFEIDYPGKDSYELRKAGANQVLIGSRKRWALITENLDKQDKSLEYHVNNLDLDNLDLVLVEGFKPEIIPKIELHRPSLGKKLLFPEDESIIAIATDAKIQDTKNLPCLDLNKPDEIAQFVIERFLGDSQANT